jgi:glycosyltransferase involved in cell wall biosynthesis
VTTRPAQLKVLFLASSYPRNESDSAAVFLRYLAEALAARGIDIHVLTPADGKSPRTIEAGITVHRFQYFPVRWQKLAYGSGIMPNLKRSPSLWLQVPCFFMAQALATVRLIKKQRFDLLHAHWLLPQGLIARFGAALFGIPLVVTAHGSDAFALRSKVASWLKRLVVNQSNAWTANTVITAQAISKDSEARAPRIIPMGVDVARFSTGDGAALRSQLPKGELVILFVGRLIESKGCHDLLQALSLLDSKIRARVTLWVIGDGDRREMLMQAARDLGIQDKTRFFGALNHDRLADFYAAADIVVIPSKLGPSGESEGQGVVVLEAFAARACVVATRIGGLTSMVRDQATGFLSDPNNPQALSSALGQLLGDPALRQRLADNAFIEVREKYDWAQIAGEFDKLYCEILGAPHR